MKLESRCPDQEFTPASSIIDVAKQVPGSHLFVVMGPLQAIPSEPFLSIYILVYCGAGWGLGQLMHCLSHCLTHSFI